jgi:hypothetical protein
VKEEVGRGSHQQPKSWQSELRKVVKSVTHLAQVVALPG